MIISCSFSCLLFHWRCFNVSLFRQCSIIVLRCSAVFRLFRRCSIVPVLFRCSGVVPSFSGCSMFRCSGGVPLFRRCSVVLQVFCVPGFIVRHFVLDRQDEVPAPLRQKAKPTFGNNKTMCETDEKGKEK